MTPSSVGIVILSTLVASFGAGVVSLAVGKRAHLLVHATLAAATGVGTIALVAVLAGQVARPTFATDAVTLDDLSLLFSLVVDAVGFLVSLYALGYVRRHAETYDLRVTNALYAFFLFGMQGVLLAATPFGFLLCWEAMSVASFLVVMADRSAASVKAALFYFVMTHLGAGALLAAFGLVSFGHLSWSFDAIGGILRSTLPAAEVGVTIPVASALFLVGFGSKAGLWPLHAWLPEAHPQAPSHVSALMSGVMLKIAVYGFLRVVVTVLPPIPGAWAMLVIALGLVSAVVGALSAAVDRDLKRTLAFSSIENVGIIFTMIGTAMLASSADLPTLATVAMAAAVLHVVVHAFFKSGLFMAAGAVIDQVHTRRLEAMGGLARRMGAFSVAACVLMLVAAALPPGGAFFGEWLFLNELVSTLAAAPMPVVAVLTATLTVTAFVGGLAVFAMTKTFAIVFLGEPRSDRAAAAGRPPALLAVPVMVAAAVAGGFGLVAPSLLSALGLDGAVASAGDAVATSSATLPPSAFLFAAGAAVVVAYGVRRLLAGRGSVRVHPTWDCGQPTTPGMEYTATAFSGPIRFIFSPLLRMRQEVTRTPVVATNPWIATASFRLELRDVCMESLYAPVARATLFLSTQVRRLQNGVIQSYVALILLALVVTLRLAL